MKLKKSTKNLYACKIENEPIIIYIFESGWEGFYNVITECGDGNYDVSHELLTKKMIRKIHNIEIEDEK